MSAKHSYTTADYLPWDTAMALVRKLSIGMAITECPSYLDAGSSLGFVSAT